MKFTQLMNRHYKWTKYTTNEKYIEFKPETRMELKKSVAGTKQKFSANACIQEMFVMMACLKKYEFDQSSCTNEIRSFRGCNENYFSGREVRLQNERTGALTPGSKHLSPIQANNLLKKYPPPPPKNRT